MTDYIKAGVELADGFAPEALQVSQTEDLVVGFEEQFFLDALAAQLVRQVDALPSPNPDYVRRTILGIWADSASLIEFVGGTYEETLVDFDDNDRTMNTIKAIVDSGVLK